MATWSELYLLFELVEGSVGGRMHDLGWLSKGQKERFTRTANSYKLLGIRSRHATETVEGPAHPMTHAHAVRLLTELTTHWLRYLVPDSDASSAHKKP